jgi:hypothetical protein
MNPTKSKTPFLAACSKSESLLGFRIYVHTASKEAKNVASKRFSKCVNLVSVQNSSFAIRLAPAIGTRI